MTTVLQHQYNLALITHPVGDSIVDQRASDGFIDATSLCQAAGKLLGHYLENGRTTEFLVALASDIGIPISGLVQRVKGGAGRQGTWVHPQVAIHLAQWLSPRFAVQVTKWIYEWMLRIDRPQAPAQLPVHLRRYMANEPKVSTGYFSVLQETGLNLFGPLHNLGFDIPENWVPDISIGKMFCAWLRVERKFDTDTLPTYEHAYPDGRIVSANLYPDRFLADFRNWFRTVWLPVHGTRYFKSKDRNSLQYLERHPALANPVRPPPVGRLRNRKGGPAAV